MKTMTTPEPQRDEDADAARQRTAEDLAAGEALHQRGRVPALEGAPDHGAEEQVHPGASRRGRP